MEVDLSHAEPVNFIHTHVVKWLKDHAEPVDEREHVPYKILVDSISCNNSTRQDMEGPDQEVSGRGGGGRGDGDRGGGGRGGGGRGGDGDSGGNDNDAVEETIPFVAVSVSTIDSLAPLPENTEPLLHKEGEHWYRLLITFDVEILPQPRTASADGKGGRS